MTLTAEGMGGRESGDAVTNRKAALQDATEGPVQATVRQLPAAANPARWIPPESVPPWLSVAGWAYLYECGTLHFSDALHAHGRIVASAELTMTQADMDDFLDELRWAKEHEVPEV